MNAGENIMSVGGGVHDDAVDVTYSTKPDNPTMAQGAMETTTTSSAEYSLGAGAETEMTQGYGLDLGATVGNTINLEGTTTGMEFGATTTTESAGFDMGAMTTGEAVESTGFEATGAGFEATGAGLQTTGAEFQTTGAEFEATGAGLETTGAGFEATGAGFETTGAEFQTTGAGFEATGAGFEGTTTTTTTTTSTEYGMGVGAGAEFSSGSVMGVTEATHDEAVDVTYSTKPDTQVNTQVNTQVTNLGTVDLGLLI